jgi:hypothetical protein
MDLGPPRTAQDENEARGQVDTTGIGGIIGRIQQIDKSLRVGGHAESTAGIAGTRALPQRIRRGRRR